MEETWVDFKAVKQAVSIMQIVEHYGLKLRRSNQTTLRGACPLPCHGSKDSKGSFSIETTKNVWSCQSESCKAARKGAVGGNILDLVAGIEQCTIREAACKVAEWFNLNSAATAAASGASTAPPARSEGKPVAVAKETQEPQLAAREVQPEVLVNKPLAFELHGLSYCDYLAGRGISEEQAGKYGVGLFPGRGTMAGRLVFPIHDEVGQLVAYVGRAIDDAEPKYKFPAGFHKSLVLYNLHRALAAGVTSIVLVEGFFGLYAVEALHLTSVALMGSSMSERQLELLSRFRMVTVLLDGDEAGRKASVDVSSRLVHRCFVRVVDLPDGKQPDHLAPAALSALLA